MALSPELKEALTTSRSLTFHSTSSQPEVHRLLLYMFRNGWAVQDNLRGVCHSRWRLNGKGPWLAIRTAVKRQVDFDHVWGFSKKEIHEIGLEMQRAMENRWSAQEMGELIDKLLKLAELLGTIC